MNMRKKLDVNIPNLAGGSHQLEETMNLAEWTSGNSTINTGSAILKHAKRFSELQL
jgi:hypothetical protein